MGFYMCLYVFMCFLYVVICVFICLYTAAAIAAIAAAAAAAAAAPESCAMIGFALRDSLPGAPWPMGLLKDYVHTSIYIYIYIYMGPHGHIWAHGPCGPS